MLRTTTTTLATIALLAAPAGAAQAAPDDIASEPQANPAQMVASIQGQLAGRAFGWQFAIAQDGKLVQASTVGASGFALSGADAGGSPVAMAPTMLMDIARRRRRSPPSRP